MPDGATEGVRDVETHREKLHSFKCYACSRAAFLTTVLVVSGSLSNKLFHSAGCKCDTKFVEDNEIVERHAQHARLLQYEETVPLKSVFSFSAPKTFEPRALVGLVRSVLIESFQASFRWFGWHSRCSVRQKIGDRFPTLSHFHSISRYRTQ